MLPVAVGPLVRTSAALTPCHAVAAFCTSHTLSVPHLGSSFFKFDCVPETLRTAFCEAPVSQNQRNRQGVPWQSPGSRPPMFAHLRRTEPMPSPRASEGRAYAISGAASPLPTARRNARNDSASRARAPPDAGARFETARSSPLENSARTANLRPASSETRSNLESASSVSRNSPGCPGWAASIRTTSSPGEKTGVPGTHQATSPTRPPGRRRVSVSGAAPFNDSSRWSVTNVNGSDSPLSHSRRVSRAMTLARTIRGAWPARSASDIGRYVAAESTRPGSAAARASGKRRRGRIARFMALLRVSEDTPLVRRRKGFNANPPRQSSRGAERRGIPGSTRDRPDRVRDFSLRSG